MFIGQSPSGNVVVVDDVLSAGTAAKESIDLILENDATPSGILVGLNRQEKGTSAQSASFELEQTYNLKVLSVICLDDLIRFLKQSDQAEFIDSMESYRDEWGA
jgi:orotate phosphoribosyltransferase